MQTFLWHRALGSASSRSLPVTSLVDVPRCDVTRAGHARGHQPLQSTPGQERQGPGWSRAARSASGLPAGHLAAQLMRAGPAAAGDAEANMGFILPNPSKWKAWKRTSHVSRAAGHLYHRCQSAQGFCRLASQSTRVTHKVGMRWVRLCAGPQPIWRSCTTMPRATRLWLDW